MFEKEELIPGMESYMEDTDVSVEVSVADEPEAVAEQVETVEDQVEVEESTTEAEEDAEQVEMIAKSFDQIEMMHDFVSKHGVDRTFLYFHAPKLRAMHIDVPAMESFDTVGDPNSAISIAAQEGLAEAASAVWAWIKKICAKIRDFVKRIFSSIMAAFGNIDKQIGRLRDAYGKMDSDGTKVADSKSEYDIATPNELVKLASELDKVATAVRTYIAADTDYAKTVDAQSKADKPDKQLMESKKDTVKKAKEAVEDAFKKFNDGKKDIKSKKLSEVAWTDIPKFLDQATVMRKHVEGKKQEAAQIELLSKQMEETAKSAERRKDVDNKNIGTTDHATLRANAKDAAMQVSKGSAFFGRLMGEYNWIARKAVKSASTRMMSGGKKKAD